MSPPALARFHSDLQHTRREFPQALTLPGAAYTSPEVYALEQRALFGRSWLCVGHVAQWPKPGDFSVLDIAGDSVLLLRAQDGILRAHFNVCRHRGSKLVLESAGHGLARMLCPYHAWSYQADGSLQQAPQMPAGFCKEDHGLIPVRMEIFEGLVFVTLDEKAPPIDEHFRELPDLSRYRMGELVPGGRIEYEVGANWKLVCENYSECYHCPGAHPQLARLTELIGRNERAQEIGNCFNGGPMRLRTGVQTMSHSGASPLRRIAGITDEDARYVNYYVVYPNLLLSPHPDYVMTHLLWPIAPDRTKVVCDFFVTREARDAANYDASDVIDFWDVTNRQDWLLCERVQAAASSRGFRQGPYQTSEDCVHTFDRWYAESMATLNGEAGRAP